MDPNTSYSFTVTFDNVAGLKLEDTLDASYQVTDDNKIQQTFTLKSGETKTFTGIPAGTEYTISKAASTDGSTLKSVTDSLASTPAAKIFSLPKTGGIGTILYTLIGVACMSSVIVFFYIKKKKKA